MGWGACPFHYVNVPDPSRSGVVVWAHEDWRAFGIEIAEALSEIGIPAVREPNTSKAHPVQIEVLPKALAQRAF
jgi:hypothetical protein